MKNKFLSTATLALTCSIFSGTLTVAMQDDGDQLPAAAAVSSLSMPEVESGALTPAQYEPIREAEEAAQMRRVRQAKVERLRREIAENGSVRNLSQGEVDWLKRKVLFHRHLYSVTYSMVADGEERQGIQLRASAMIGLWSALHYCQGWPDGRRIAPSHYHIQAAKELIVILADIESGRAGNSPMVQHLTSNDGVQEVAGRVFPNMDALQPVGTAEGLIDFLIVQATKREKTFREKLQERVRKWEESQRALKEKRINGAVEQWKDTKGIVKQHRAFREGVLERARARAERRRSRRGQ